jgi:hypothetical protein
VAALLKIFMGLALVHFQKYWLLRVIFDQWLKLHLGLDVLSIQKILKGIYYTSYENKYPISPYSFLP